MLDGTSPDDVDILDAPQMIPQRPVASAAVFDPPRELFLGIPLAVDRFDKRLAIRQHRIRRDGFGAPVCTEN
jgi:hypothetical protein